MKGHPSIDATAPSLARPGRQIASMAGESRSSVSGFCNEALSPTVISAGQHGLGGQQAVRSPRALRLHPAFNELNLAGWLINSELQGKPQEVREPILITQDSILVAGFAEWHAAVCAGQAEVVCIQCVLNQDEALQVILALHRPGTAWNDFTRTELALEQERYFQSKALANQSAGGKYKGLANLPKVEHIDVREKIADVAGVSPRTVGTVKAILKRAHPSLVEALHNGTITINGALEVCKFERTQQIEELAYLLAKKSNSKTNRVYTDKLRVEQISTDLNVFFARLQQFEATNPGSLEIRPGTGKKTVIVVGKGHLNALASGTQAGLV